MKVKYNVPSRIAINLYDMNGDLGRVDGGMGFSLEYPRLIFEAEKSDELIIEDNNIIGQEMKNDIEKALRIIKNKFNFENYIKIVIKESIPEHSGFGSKTATLLSIGHAYCKLNNKEISYKKLGELLTRGGTSGLGINLIDKGGFILEGGHSTRDKKLFQPSSSVEKVVAAPILARYESDWEVLLLVPKIDRVFGEKERNFFDQICPIDEKDIEKLARITLSMVLPAVIENNLDDFNKGINLIQNRTWKKSEIELHGEKIKNLINNVREIDPSIGVGMSSIGPAVYVFGKDLEKIRDNFIKEDFEILKITKIRNNGVEIMEVIE